MSNRSMSASETESQFESFRSAIQSEFPPHSDDDPETGTAPRVKGTSQPVTEAVSARSPRRELMVKRAELGVRVCEMVLCLISLSVMVADRSRGWSGDSYYRYKEYRYCIAVTFIGLVYSGFQSFALAYNLITGKHVIVQYLRYHFDFAMDQTLAYLLISASSSAATRVDDWVSNWGGGEFTDMAGASIAVSFLAFVALALSSLISGYNLSNCITAGS